VCEATVTDTLGRGAVVALGDGNEGFLPYDAVDGYLDDGDTLRVQVHDPAPPWDDSRPLVDTRIRVFGGVASLRRGSEETTVAANGAEARELAGLGDLLSADAPDGWGVRWERAATDADLSAMDEALSNGVERAEQIDEALAGASADAPASEDSPSEGDEPGRLVAPEATTWVWFGRESRFALDDLRRAVTPTMAGHHRTKAARNSASTAVDFVEGVCQSIEEFPQRAVLQQFGPREDASVAIEHGKPDGRLFTLGRGTVTDIDHEEGRLTVRRKMGGSGVYDGLGVPKESGDVAITKFTEGRWWYPTTYRSADGESKGTYVNVCTPVECFPNAVRYVDLHVDVLAHADGSVERVDDDELDEAVEAGHVSEALAKKARVVAGSVERALSK
jgi:Ribonuclease G/E